jgi:hypothetical protein
MRIAKSLMLGAAGSVLVAGGAMAADPMPVVVSTVPTVVVATPGREVAIDVIAEAAFSLGFSTFGIGGTIDVTSASGWGVRFEGGGSVTPGFFSSGLASLALYRSFGDLDLGVWAAAMVLAPPPTFGVAAGLSARYEHDGDRIYISSENSLTLYPTIGFGSNTRLEFDLTDRFTLSSYFNYGSAGGWSGGVGVDMDVTDRLEFWSNLYYAWYGLDDIEFGAELAVTERFSVWTEANFDFGMGVEFDWLDVGTTFAPNEQVSIKNMLSINATPSAITYEAWAELDRPLGSGPLSLTGELGVGYNFTFGGGYVWGNVGLRYKLGGPEDHDDNRLFGDEG